MGQGYCHFGVFSTSHFVPLAPIDGAQLGLESTHFLSLTLFCHLQGGFPWESAHFSSQTLLVTNGGPNWPWRVSKNWPFGCLHYAFVWCKMGEIATGLGPLFETADINPPGSIVVRTSIEKESLRKRWKVQIRNLSFSMWPSYHFLVFSTLIT